MPWYAVRSLHGDRYSGLYGGSTLVTAYRGTAIAEPRYAVDYYTDDAKVCVVERKWYHKLPMYIIKYIVNHHPDVSWLKRLQKAQRSTAKRWSFLRGKFYRRSVSTRWYRSSCNLHPKNKNMDGKEIQISICLQIALHMIKKYKEPSCRSLDRSQKEKMV